MPTTQFYPDADTESTSVDGEADRDLSGGSDSTWSDVRDGTGTGSDDSNSTLQASVEAGDPDSDTWRAIFRGILLFDTSSIGSGATIDSATLYLNLQTTTNDFGGGLDVVGSTPGSNTLLTSTDYGQVGTTQYATRVNISSLTTGAYNSFALNATGLANIDPTGITKLGLRISWDTDDSPPTWIDLGLDLVMVWSADRVNTPDQRPYLEVTYTPPAAATGASTLSLMGVG